MLNMAPHLARLGVDVTIAAPADGELIRAARAEGVAVRVLELPAHAGVVDIGQPRRRSTAANALRELPRVARGIRAVARATAGADVVHSNSLLATMDCAASGRLHRRPTVLEIHDLVRAGTSRRLLSAALRLADAGIAVSSPVAANVETWAARRITLIAQAVNTELYSPAPLEARVRAELSAAPEQPLVAIVGRVDEVKRVEVVVAAIDELNRSGTTCALAVVGDASAGNEAYARTMRARAERTLGERVRFVGIRSDVPDVLRAVDVVVNASLDEPFGLAILEAQACGTPVVGHDSGGLPDFVVDGQTGRLVRSPDPAALARTLREVIDAPQLAQKMAATARTQACERYSLPARAGALDVLYRSVARDRRTP